MSSTESRSVLCNEMPLPNLPKKKSSTRKKAPEDRVRRPRFLWRGRCEELLLEWLTTEGNYDRWKSTSTAGGQKGQKKVSGDSKRQIAAEVAELLQAAGFPSADAKIVQNKIELLETSYKNARSCENGTGFGITDSDIAKSITTVEQKMLVLCPHFDKLDSVFGGRAAMDPPFTAGTSDDLSEDATILFECQNNIEDEAHTPNSGDETETVEGNASASDSAADAETPGDTQREIPQGSPTNTNESTSRTKRARLAPSQQKADTARRNVSSATKNLTSISGRPAAGSSMDSFFLKKADYMEGKMKLQKEKQQMAEKKLELDHEARLKDIDVRRIEAEAAKEQATSNRLLLEYFLKKTTVLGDPA